MRRENDKIENMKQSQEAIVIKNPSKQLLNWIEKCRAKKLARREEIRNMKPMFTISVK